MLHIQLLLLKNDTTQISQVLIRLECAKRHTHPVLHRKKSIQVTCAVYTTLQISDERQVLRVLPSSGEMTLNFSAFGKV